LGEGPPSKLALDGVEEVEISLFKQNLLKGQIGENRNFESSTQNSTEIWMGKSMKTATKISF